MLGIAILLFIGSIIQLIFVGGTLGIVQFILSCILLLMTLPVLQKNKLAKVIPIFIIILFLVSGSLFNPFPEERETASQYNKAMTLYSQEKYQKSLDVFTVLVEKTPNDSQIHLGLGLLYMAMDDYSKSWEHLNRARQLNPYDINILYNSALNRYHVGSLQESLAGFENLVKINPELLESRIYSGILSMELGNFPRGLYHINEAIKLRPDISKLYYYLGKCHMGMMEYMDAESAFKKALELKPSSELENELNIELQELKTYIGGEI